MPSKSKIMALPDDVRARLEERVRDSLFRDYDGHEKWLAQQGYAISRSLIQRHAEQHRARIKSLPRADGSGPASRGPLTPADQRLECLRLAAVHAPSSPERHIAIAEALFSWLHQGAPKPAGAGPA